MALIKDIFMTTSKKLLVAACILTTSLTQAAWMMNFDYTTFYSYVKQAEINLDTVAAQLLCENHGSKDIAWTGKSYADALYPKQKAALKIILKELQHNTLKSPNNDNTATLSKLFKYEVYKSWKRTFKNNYNDSIKNNNISTWTWLHEPASILIHE